MFDPHVMLLTLRWVFLFAHEAFLIVKFNKKIVGRSKMRALIVLPLGWPWTQNYYSIILRDTQNQLQSLVTKKKNYK